LGLFFFELKHSPILVNDKPHVMGHQPMHRLSLAPSLLITSAPFHRLYLHTSWIDRPHLKPSPLSGFKDISFGLALCKNSGYRCRFGELLCSLALLAEFCKSFHAGLVGSSSSGRTPMQLYKATHGPMGLSNTQSTKKTATGDLHTEKTP
jgi:hypothetical protein